MAVGLGVKCYYYIVKNLLQCNTTTQNGRDLHCHPATTTFIRAGLVGILGIEHVNMTKTDWGVVPRIYML